MRVSVIVTIYKDLVSLGIVLEALRRQTYKNFEIIVAEDDDAKETIEFLKDFKDLKILHLSQADTGRNKVVIQNKAISQAQGEYLIFIDGDIVPFKHFIEYTLKISKPKRILAGRRVNLNEEMSAQIKQKKLNIEDIENKYFKYLMQNKNDRNARVEQGIQLNPEGFIYKHFLSKRVRNTEILGCNFSFYKEDIIAINGFDESYGYAVLGDDTDLTWRFIACGIELYSSKNIANVFHLYHPVSSPQDKHDTSDSIKRFEYRKSNNLYIVEDEYGLSKYFC